MKLKLTNFAITITKSALEKLIEIELTNSFISDISRICGLTRLRLYEITAKCSLISNLFLIKFDILALLNQAFSRSLPQIY